MKAAQLRKTFAYEFMKTLSAPCGGTSPRVGGIG